MTTIDSNRPLLLNKNHRPDIQGLRAIAIIAVILFHVYPEIFNMGYLGVDIFFVISGYLICVTLSRSILKNTFCFSTVTDFYYRRIVRILPLSILFICLATMLCIFYIIPEKIEDVQKNAWYALSFTTNIWTILNNGGYFESLHEYSLFTHMWSLSVEMQFYFIVPFILLVQFSLPTMFRDKFLPLISLLSLIVYTFTSETVRFNLVFLRLWQFFASTIFNLNLSLNRKGPGFAALPLVSAQPEPEIIVTPAERRLEKISEVRHTNSGRLKRTIVISLYNLSTVFVCLVFLPNIINNANYFFYWQILVTFGAAFVISFGKDIESPFLSNQITAYIGDISYSLYIWHWPIVVLLTTNTPISSFHRVSAITTSFFVAVPSFFLYEKKYRTWTKKTTIISVILFVIVSIFLIIFAPLFNATLYKTDPALEAIIAKNKAALDAAVLKPRFNVEYKSWKSLKAPEGIGRWPNSTGKLKFAVIGNSYAEDMNIHIWKVFHQHYSTFSTFSQWSCEILAYTRRKWCRHEADVNEVLDYLQPDVLFITQRYFRAKIDPVPVDGERDESLEEMEYYLNQIKNRTSLIFILDAMPSVNQAQVENVFEMLRRNMSADAMNESMLIRDEHNARIRTRKLVDKCEKCVLYNIDDVFLDSQGIFRAIDPKSFELIFNQVSHLSPLGMDRALMSYSALKDKIIPRLEVLEEQLYPNISS